MHNNKKGFTLIEIIAVIAVIAILALAIVPNIMSYRKKAKVSNAVSDAKVIIDEYRNYCADNNESYDDYLHQNKKLSEIYTDISNCVSVPSEFDYNKDANSDLKVLELEKIKDKEWKVDTDFIINSNNQIEKK